MRSVHSLLSKCGLDAKDNTVRGGHSGRENFEGFEVARSVSRTGVTKSGPTDRPHPRIVHLLI